MLEVSKSLEPGSKRGPQPERDTVLRRLVAGAARGAVYRVRVVEASGQPLLDPPIQACRRGERIRVRAALAIAHTCELVGAVVCAQIGTNEGGHLIAESTRE